MYSEFRVGDQFPRAEDVERLERYVQAAVLFNGEHYDSSAAKRIAQKLKESQQFSGWDTITAEGIVYLVFNLPRLIVQKFADLQVLQEPIVLMDDEAAEEAFLDRLREDIPDLWGRIHYAKQIQRAFGDVLLTMRRDEQKQLDLRVISPDRWFPVLDENDPLTVVAHQIAWIEAKDVGKRSVDFLRVDVCYPDRLERRAFELEGRQGGKKELKRAAPLSEHWANLREVDTADLGGLMSCVHMANGSLDPDRIFGRPEFIDSAALIDDVNWRLAAWSDANDKVSHAPRIIPNGYLDQNNDGLVTVPSQYTRVYAGKSKADPSEYPRYMEYTLDHQTLLDQFQQSFLSLLIRHEMSPALLGYQFGNEKESGEAKSLGMGTTEAATRRDLLQTRPQVERALTVLARMAGDASAQIRTHWRVGLPKTQAELRMEAQEEMNMGLLTKRGALQRLYPHYSEDQIEQLLAELKEERAAEAAEFESPFEARQG